MYNLRLLGVLKTRYYSNHGRHAGSAIQRTHAVSLISPGAGLHGISADPWVYNNYAAAWGAYPEPALNYYPDKFNGFTCCDGGLSHAAMQPSTYTAFSARYALHRENGRLEFSSLTRGV